jgi:hypothetical protein
MNWNKRGEAGDTLITETVLFIILNLIFFSALFYFVYSAGNSALVYEQVYAKGIATAIDSAKPETVIIFGLERIEKIIKSEKLNLDKVFSIDDKKHIILVTLGKGGGYSYKFFSDYKIAKSLENNKLKITISKNE